ncbi:MAG: serine beta-lactamase-like protein LACTB [Paraglaciecola sp.]|jgi:serine beta-lactamase-like protein LACTB
MKQFAILFIAIINTFILIGQTPETTWHAAANELLEQQIKDKKCVGVAAGFSIVDGARWSGGEGYRNQVDKTPFTTETITRLASIAKPMTAIAIMQLVEQGKIDLEAAVQTYIPDFPIKKEGTITVKNLLQHSSGINGFKSNKERNNKVEYLNLAAATELFKNRDLLATPGEAFNYTSYGYTVLGLIIEKASGLTYEAYMQKNI